MPRTHLLVDTSHFVSLWDLPDSDWDDRWDRIIVDADVKESLLNFALLSLVTLSGTSEVGIPMHRMVLLEGPPGTGKTTLARGYGNRAAELLKEQTGKKSIFVEVDCFSLSGELLGTTPKAIAKLLEEIVPDVAKEADFVFLLFDEVETIATDRRSLSLEVNPVDVHRGTNAFLTGMDFIASQVPNVMSIMTTNYPENLDSAVVSRVDVTYALDIPKVEAVRNIVADTAGEMEKTMAVVGDDAAIEKAVQNACGLDGRQIRKAMIEAATLDRKVASGQAPLTWDLIAQTLANRRSQLDI
jgi:pachytene checkpoint protein 2